MSATTRHKKKKTERSPQPTAPILGDGFDQPSTEITEVDAVFGARALDFMPSYQDIPEEFRRGAGEALAWFEFQSRWFFSGVAKSEVTPRSDVDAETAWRHLRMIQGSFAPKHEHKEAAVAWLASRWFAAVSTTR